MRLLSNETITLAVCETSALCGIGQPRRSSPCAWRQGLAWILSHNTVFDALIALAWGDTVRVGPYSPAFARDTPKNQVRGEIKQLNIRYLLRIAWSIYYDPVTGGLSM
ncbi:MAG: hypothetical protein ACYCY1_12030 [Sulfuriferula sp.]